MCVCVCHGALHHFQISTKCHAALLSNSIYTFSCTNEGHSPKPSQWHKVHEGGQSKACLIFSVNGCNTPGHIPVFNYFQCYRTELLCRSRPALFPWSCALHLILKDIKKLTLILTQKPLTCLSAVSVLDGNGWREPFSPELEYLHVLCKAICVIMSSEWCITTTRTILNSLIMLFYWF